MKKKLLSLLVLVLLSAIGSLGLAQDAKPVAAISFSGFEALRADVRYLGALMGQPDLAAAMDGLITIGTEGKGLQGLDTKRPWGAVVFSHEEEFSFAVFLPTTDLQALADTLGVLDIRATDQGDGTYEVLTPLLPMVMMERNGWAIMADQAKTFDSLPDDPTTLLGPLVGKYDLGLMAHVANLPDGVRQMVLAQISMGAAMGMQQQPDESDEQYAFRRNMTERSIQQLTTMLNELDRFMLGISVDGEAAAGMIEVAVSAKEGTKTAEQFALLKGTQTNFAGFDQPEAAMSAIASARLTDDDVEQYKSLLEGVQAAATEDLLKQDLSDAEMTLAKRLIVELFAMLEDNIEAKLVDGGMVVKLGPDQLTAVVGMHVTDGPKIEGLVKEFVEQLLKDEPAASDHVKLDAETHAGVNLHMVSVPTEAMDEAAEQMRKLVGAQMNVVVGIGPNSIYLAAGRDAVVELKQVIDASQAEPGKAVSPTRVHVALGPIVKMLAELAEEDSVREMAGMMALNLSQSPGKDRVTVETRPIPNGSVTRITLEEGVLRLIGTGAIMAQQMAGPGGF